MHAYCAYSYPSYSPCCLVILCAVCAQHSLFLFHTHLFDFLKHDYSNWLCYKYLLNPMKKSSKVLSTMNSIGYFPLKYSNHFHTLDPPHTLLLTIQPSCRVHLQAQNFFPHQWQWRLQFWLLLYFLVFWHHASIHKKDQHMPPLNTFSKEQSITLHVS